MSERVIYLDDNEAHLLLEALAGHMARSGKPAEVTATIRLAQRIEGFEIDGRPGAKSIVQGERIGRLVFDDDASHDQASPRGESEIPVTRS